MSTTLGEPQSGRGWCRRRFPEGVAGLAGLHALIADHLPDDADPADVVVGIETDRGPWVQALIAAGLHGVRGEPVAGGQVSGTAWHVRGEERPG